MKYLVALLLTFSTANAFAQEQINYGEEFSQQGQNDDFYYDETSPGYNDDYATYNQPYSTNNQAYNNSNTKKINISIGAGSVYTKEYKGADNYKFESIILPSVTYNLDPWQKLYFSYPDGAGYAYKLTDNLELGAGLGYRNGRDSSDDYILTGLADVKDTLTYKTFAKYYLNKYTFSVALEKGIRNSNDGLTTTFAANYRTQVNNKLSLGAKTSLIYANDSYMKQNFGVSAANATGYRSAHNANAGFAEATAGVYATNNIFGNHNITTGLNYSQLLGDAKTSSITQDSSALSLMLGYSYKF